MRFVYPRGLGKALTFSYDDGQKYDKRLAELLREHGMKGTFHLNSGTLGLNRANDTFIAAEEVKMVYAGHEVACHGVQHRNPPTITKQQMILEIQEDRKALEKLTEGVPSTMHLMLPEAFLEHREKFATAAQLNATRYAQAGAYRSARGETDADTLANLEQAILLYGALGDYAASAVKLQETTYEKAVLLSSMGFYAEAKAA